jgi:hypothetical protein
MRLHCAKSLTYINGRTNSGRCAKDMELPGFKFHALKSDRKGE